MQVGRTVVLLLSAFPDVSPGDLAPAQDDSVDKSPSTRNFKDQVLPSRQFVLLPASDPPGRQSGMGSQRRHLARGRR